MSTKGIAETHASLNIIYIWLSGLWVSVIFLRNDVFIIWSFLIKNFIGFIVFPQHRDGLSGCRSRVKRSRWSWFRWALVRKYLLYQRTQTLFGSVKTLTTTNLCSVLWHGENTNIISFVERKNHLTCCWGSDSGDFPFWEDILFCRWLLAFSLRSSFLSGSRVALMRVFLQLVLWMFQSKLIFKEAITLKGIPEFVKEVLTVKCELW